MHRQRGVRRGRRGLLAAAVAALAALALVLAPTALDGARASFSATTANTGDELVAGQLQPASNLTATQSCSTMPDITQRSTSTTAVGQGVVTLPVPTGLQTGDYLLAQVAYHDSAQTLTVPSDWKPAGRTANTSVASNVYWKEWKGETTATFRHPTPGSTLWFAGGMTAFRGVRLVAPQFAGVFDSTTAAITPSVTPTDTRVQVVHLFAKTQGPLNPVSGITNYYDDSTGNTSGEHVGIRGAGETFAGPGPTTSRTATAATDSRWVAQTVVLRRAAGTPSAQLSWTATPSTWADGYVLAREVSGSVQEKTTLSPRTTASTTQSALVNSTTYVFRLTAVKGTWRSADVTATLTPNC